MVTGFTISKTLTVAVPPPPFEVITGLASTVTFSAADAPLVLPAASVTVVVKLWAPLARLLALRLQAPVASDLRTVAALLHVIKHVERMGDQCVNIAKMLPVVGYEPPSDEVMLEHIFKMGKLARSEVGQAKQAFLLRDVEVAQDLVRQDDAVDNLNRRCFSLALDIGEDPDRREWAMSMMLVARALERIGDNAVDIGEQVAFVVTGEFREFSDASHVT